MFSTLVTRLAAPWSRSHSTERIPKLELEGSSIVAANEIAAGTNAMTAAQTSTRRTRWGVVALAVSLQAAGAWAPVREAGK